MKATTNVCAKGSLIGFALALVLAFSNGMSPLRGQTPPAVSPGLEEIVKLSKAQMGDEVILGYIKKSGTAYNLTSDDIVYLKNQGVSQPVITALLSSKPASVPAPIPPAPPVAPAVAAPPAAPPIAPPITAAPGEQPPVAAPPGAPPGEVNFAYFHDQLAPFGSWIDIDGVMYWRPDAAMRMNPDFRPYYDMGRWVQTENGLFWQSDYVWGDIPFHYGRWISDPVRGWLWLPEYEWAPAWVFWRHAEADGAIGWAPLPVGAVIVEGGYMWRGARVGLEFDFGMGAGVFVFVGYDHFHEGFFRMRGREWAWHVHGDRLHEFYRRSVVRNEFHRDEHGRLVNHGIGRERVAAVTHGRVERSNFQERKPVGDRNATSHETAQKAATTAKQGTGAKPAETGKPAVASGANTAKPASGTATSGSSPASSSASKVYRPPATTAGSSSGSGSSSAGKPITPSSSSSQKKR